MKYSILCSLLLFLISCGSSSGTYHMADRVKRGEYLVKFGGCNDCHTPKVFTPGGPVPDTDRYLSGHPSEKPVTKEQLSKISAQGWILFNQDLTASVGPWGVSYAHNLTPDKNTGIGMWSERTFIEAMRNGKHMGKGRPILPPMPWNNIGALSDEDLASVFAYLKSLKPVSNKVPSPISYEDMMKSQY